MCQSAADEQSYDTFEIEVARDMPMRATTSTVFAVHVANQAVADQLQQIALVVHSFTDSSPCVVCILAEPYTVPELAWTASQPRLIRTHLIQLSFCGGNTGHTRLQLCLWVCIQAENKNIVFIKVVFVCYTLTVQKLNT